MVKIYIHIFKKKNMIRSYEVNNLYCLFMKEELYFWTRFSNAICHQYYYYEFLLLFSEGFRLSECIWIAKKMRNWTEQKYWRKKKLNKNIFFWQAEQKYLSWVWFKNEKRMTGIGQEKKHLSCAWFKKLIKENTK